MMNILALSLVLTSILTAGFFSPTPEPSNTQNRGGERDAVIVKDGHRVVVVEYDHPREGDGNTKILISPHETHVNLEESPSAENLEGGSVSSSGPKELICDAFGKCKEKIASVVGWSKDKVVEASEKASDKIHNVNEEVSDSVGTVTNKAEQAAHKVYDVAKDAKDKVKETVTKASQKESDKIHNVNGEESDSVGIVTNKAEQAAHKISDVAKDAKDKVKETVTDSVGTMTNKVKETETDSLGTITSKVKETVTDTVGTMTNKVKETVTDSVGSMTNKAEQAARIAADKVYDVTKDVKDKVKESDKPKDVAHRVSGKVKEMAGKIPGMARYAAKDTVAMSENLGLDVERNLTDFIEPVSRKPKEEMDMVEEGVNKMKEEGGTKTFRRFLNYVVGMEAAALAVVHLLGFSVAYGTCFWVTFASSYVLSKYVAPHQYGLVQSKLYGVYFKAMSYSVGTAFVAHLLSQRGRIWSSRGMMFQGWNLLFSVSTVLVNMLYVEPQVTKVMFERMKLEKEEGRGGGRDGLNIAEPSSRSIARSQPERDPVKDTDTGEAAEVKMKAARLCDRLKKMNSYSSLINLATLMSLSWHLVFLGQTLSRAAV